MTVFKPQKEDVIYEKPFIDTKKRESRIGELSAKRLEEAINTLRDRKSLNPALKEYLFDQYYNDVYVRDVWDSDSTKPLISGSSEYLQYPTQKPLGLLERIIESCSDEGDLVADFFCGSGTTMEVAENLGRKWIGVDVGRFAVHTSRKRLIGVQRDLASKNEPYRAFEILNLGSYERQHFISRDTDVYDAGATASNEEMRSRFVDLVMSAYGGARSEQLPGFDGTKGSAAVIIGPIHAAVTEDSVRMAIDTAKKAGITRLDILGFEFEMGIKPVMQDNA